MARKLAGSYFESCSCDPARADGVRPRPASLVLPAALTMSRFARSA